MDCSYSFSNIFGGNNESGRLSFAAENDVLMVPNGNRVNVYDLRKNRMLTLPWEALFNVDHALYSPCSPIIVTIDVTGRCLTVNSVRNTTLNSFSLKGKVSVASFSRCGEFIAIAQQQKLQIWTSPTISTLWKMDLLKTIRHHVGKIVCLDWSDDARYICTASKDMTVRIFSVRNVKGFHPVSLVNHRHGLRGAFFSKDLLMIHSVGKDGTLISWKYVRNDSPEAAIHDSDPDVGHVLCRNTPVESTPHLSIGSEVPGPGCREETENNSNVYCQGKWILSKKGYCNQAPGNTVSSCKYHSGKEILVIGFSRGILSIIKVPEFDSLYTLSISNDSVSSIDINGDGEWIAIGCNKSGSVFVWEWMSETYILKQQSHNFGILSVAVSPIVDNTSYETSGIGRSAIGVGPRSLIVATGGEDGKVKLWDSLTGYNFVTFQEHVAAVNALAFVPQGNALLSASNDSSVRAFDLLRYQNFRTFTVAEHTSGFQTLAVNAAGDLVLAGSSKYIIYVWSIQTGKLLESLTGHEGPITKILFHPHPSKGGLLVSSSWDKSIRVWDLFGRVHKGGSSETLHNSSEVVSVAFNPTGTPSHLACSTMCGSIWFWNLESCQISGSIDGLRDVQSGRRKGQKFSADNTKGKVKDKFSGDGIEKHQHFSSLQFSQNGMFLFAAARHSPKICVYSTKSLSLTSVYCFTKNRSIDGLLIRLNSRYMTDAGISLQEFNLSDTDDSEGETNMRRAEHLSLPGVKLGEMKHPKTRTFRFSELEFSQDGRDLFAATSHGIFMYTLNAKLQSSVGTFSSMTSMTSLDRLTPILVTATTNKETIYKALNESRFSEALILSVSLNDFETLTDVYLSIPLEMIGVVVQSIQGFLLPSFLNFLRFIMSSETKNIEHYWDKSQTNTFVKKPYLYLQRNLEFLKYVFGYHLSTLQEVESPRSAMLPGPENSINGKYEIEKLKETNKSNLKVICVLLLRILEKLHSVLKMYFHENIRTLDVLLHTRLQF